MHMEQNILKLTDCLQSFFETPLNKEYFAAAQAAVAE